MTTNQDWWVGRYPVLVPTVSYRSIYLLYWQCYGSGWIRNQIAARIRIRIRYTDPDPERTLSWKKSTTVPIYLCEIFHDFHLILNKILPKKHSLLNKKGTYLTTFLVEKQISHNFLLIAFDKCIFTWIRIRIESNLDPEENMDPDP